MNSSEMPEVGPLLGGRAWQMAATNTFYYAAALGLVMVVLAVRTPGSPRLTASAAGNANPAPPTAPPQTNRRFIIVTRLGNFGGCFSIGIVRTMFPKLGDTLGFSTVIIGNVIACFYVSRLLLFWLAGHSSRWQYRGWVLWLGVPVGALGMLLAAAARTPLGFGAAFMISGVCLGVTYVTSIYYGMDSGPAARGATMGIHEAIVGGGMLVGPLLGGLVATWFSLRAPFLLGAVVLVLAGVAQLAVWRCCRSELAPSTTSGQN